ncbi:ATP-binding protein [Candidatus Saganbacteria bacterium]|nr:ATP-binding protein [Candidatus Saganbacteria bacterium]
MKEFKELDPNLSKLKNLPLVYHPQMVKAIPVFTPGIYIITGGRQVGKSTTLKLIIINILDQRKILPAQIYYLPCDTIRDYTQLLFEIDQFRLTLDHRKPFVLFIDEISYVKEWGRAIKSLADAGFLNHGSLVISGSDTYLLKDAMMEFPGRRGNADQQDFHLFSLSFYEYVRLNDKNIADQLERGKLEFYRNRILPKAGEIEPKTIKKLKEYFESYLFTGGYLSAINDYKKHGNIANATYKTYVQWIIGDMLKRGKNELFLREIIKALLLRLSQQITWHSLVSDLSIEHHQTIADYILLLERMDVAVILQVLKEEKMRPAPKKARKVSFSDPFILHALNGWVYNHNSYFDLSVETLKNNTGRLKDSLIEGIMAALFKRQFETYYIKAEGEIDLALVNGNRFFPVEIKNSTLLRKNDLKQILKQKTGVIGYAGEEIAQFEKLEVIPNPILAMLAG